MKASGLGLAPPRSSEATALSQAVPKQQQDTAGVEGFVAEK